MCLRARHAYLCGETSFDGNCVKVNDIAQLYLRIGDIVVYHDREHLQEVVLWIVLHGLNIFQNNLCFIAIRHKWVYFLVGQKL